MVEEIFTIVEKLNRKRWIKNPTRTGSLVCRNPNFLCVMCLSSLLVGWVTVGYFNRTAG